MDEELHMLRSCITALPAAMLELSSLNQAPGLPSQQCVSGGAGLPGGHDGTAGDGEAAGVGAG